MSLIVCRVCQADSRTMANCSSCHGAGISLETEAGHLVWLAPLDEFSFGFRRFQRRADAAINALIASLIFLGLAMFFGLTAWQGRLSDLLTSDFWRAGSGYVNILWLVWLLSCFLVFRWRVYRHDAKNLPNWGWVKSRRQKALTHVSRDATTVDVSVYFQAAVWTVLERAYDLAKRTGRAELEPTHLFAACLTMPFGGTFLTRLGLDFDAIKPGLAALLRQGLAGGSTTVSRRLREALLQSYQSALADGRKQVGVMEIFLQAFLSETPLQELLDRAGFPKEQIIRVMDWMRLQERLREQQQRFQALAELKPKTAMNRLMTAQQTKVLNHFSEDLTLLAREGYVAPLIGREQEMEELWRLFDSGRRAVILIGEAGVGKTAMIEEVARRMVEEDVPTALFDHRLVVVNLPRLVSSGNASAAAERLLTLLHEVAMSGNVVLALEGIEALTGIGSGGPMDLAEIIAAELQRLGILMIATTTPAAWSGYLERRALGTALAKLWIKEMEPAAAIPVLMARSAAIEYQQKVFFSYAAIAAVIQLCSRYVHDARLPQSALDIAKEVAIAARQEHGEGGVVMAEDVAKVIHQKTNIPVEAVGQEESTKLLQLERQLHGRVIGQEQAVTAVAQAMRRARAEMREQKRPIANFLFLGPTGVGKTELAKALAIEYFGSEQAMIRLDMSEYQDPSSIRRIVGAPGDDHGGLLTEAVRRQPFTIVLLDELEKAHPDILTVFLQVMDDGRLTDGVGRTIDFTNVVLIATSNAGTAFIQEQVNLHAPLEQIKTALLERELKGIFRPEFLNRFDGVIVFKPLTLDDVTQIAWLMVGAIAKRLEKDKGIVFHAEDAAVEAIAQAGFDPLFGARPLRRAIQDRLENALADLLLQKAVHRRDTIIWQADGTMRVEQA